jgi:hypothetical protein
MPALVIGTVCLVLSIAGWMAILLVALLLPGGHPPLLAYVAAPVVLATVPVSVVGLVASRKAVSRATSSPVAGWCLFAGNGLVLACAAFALIHALLA